MPEDRVKTDRSLLIASVAVLMMTLGYTATRMASSPLGLDDPRCRQGEAAGPTDDAVARYSRPTTFVRCVDRGRWKCTLQTAVVSYADRRGRTVTLVAAYHEADSSHFRAVQRTLAEYPRVLYEGWRPEPAGGSDEDSPSEPVLLELATKVSGMVVTLVWDTLGFEFVDQWSAVDYASKRFRNADMTYSEFAKRCRSEGEVYAQLQAALALLRPYVLSALLRAFPLSWEEVTWILSLPDEWRAALRYVYTKECSVANNLLAAYNGREDVWRNVTIHERNAVVVDVALEEFEEGHEKIAIYYGAVHMPDFERRLLERGFRRARIEWLDCWTTDRK